VNQSGLSWCPQNAAFKCVTSLGHRKDRMCKHGSHKEELRNRGTNSHM